MEFRQRLRALREERGITQRELADAIYVSRSAVAKWENGLGIPSRESYQALLTYFGVSEDEFPLNEGERVLCDQKRRARYVLSTILWILLLSVAVYVGWLTYALNHGYGFTADMAAGELWADNERIERPEYVFYYGTTVGELRVIDTFAVVEKRPIGYQRLYHNLKTDAHEVFDENGDLYGHLLTYKGKDGYYHLFRTTLYSHPGEPGVYMHLLPEVVIKEDAYEVFCHSFFETPFEVTEFYCEGKRYYVE